MEGEFISSHPSLEPFLLPNVRPTSKTIGAGAYGSVEVVEMPGAICAAKKIHDFFLNPTQIPSSAIQKASAQFVRECQLMSTLRHPNIVQFLGVCFLPGSQLPALVMELLLTNLHDLLDPEIEPPSPEPLTPFFPLSLKVSILQNVANGLAYLHERSPPIIHRDLSARNVLVNSGMVAKIADLGVARIIPQVQKAAATMTKGPGAIVYMPPEALESKSEEENEQARDVLSKYDSSIDIFSFGVVAIFALSQMFPCDLLAPTYRKKGRLLARTELERREKYMAVISKQLHKKHPLLPMIEGCLNFPEKRPVISEVVKRLHEAKVSIKDEKLEMNRLELVQALYAHQNNEKKLRGHVQDLEQQLLIKNQENEKLKSAKEKSKEWQQILTENKQLREKIEHLQSQAMLSDLPKSPRKREPQSPRSKAQSTYSKTRTFKSKKLSVKSCLKKKAPVAIIRGVAVTINTFAYLIPEGSSTLYQYNSNTDTWKILPQCPIWNSGLVAINNELTTVGGWNGSSRTNKLMTLEKGVWVERYPPMRTECCSPAVVTTSDGNYLFVIGGLVSGSWSTTVELFDIKTTKWYSATSLPQSLAYPSATLYGEQLYVAGSNNGCLCSVRDLLDQPLMVSWVHLPPPVISSTAATLSGQLVLVGGTQDVSSVNSIYQLVDQEWVKIGCMTGRKYLCLVVSPSPEKMLIFGGYEQSDSGVSVGTSNVEECSIK